MHTSTITHPLGSRFEIVAADAALAFRELSLPADAAILDVGTGSGYFAISLALAGYQVLTGEPATDQTQYAGRNWAESAEKAGVRERIRFQQFDATGLPFPAHSFDAVFFFGVLHHIDESHRAAALREAFRVTRPKGSVVLFEPRRNMLEKVWADDPHHPLAANPSLYLPEGKIEERRIEGKFMDIFLYRAEPSSARSTAASR